MDHVDDDNDINVDMDTKVTDESGILNVKKKTFATVTNDNLHKNYVRFVFKSSCL